MNELFYNIIINTGYDDLDKPNLSEYDFNTEWVDSIKPNNKTYLKYTHINRFLGNGLQIFKANTINYFIKTDEKFIYPIMLYGSDLFKKYETINLNSKLLNCIKEKKAKIVFFYITEGFFGMSDLDYNWIESLSTKYTLNKDDILVVTANLLAEEKYKGNKFTIVSYNFFMDFLDFTPFTKHNILSKTFQTKYIDFIDNFKIEKHFLCFNRIPKLHRLLVFYELINNSKLKNKSIITLHSPNVNKIDEFYKMIIEDSNDDKLISFYKNYDSTQSYTYDSNWIKSSNPANSLNLEAHLNTFVNIITETLVEQYAIFFTEKTYKPIYACQPFIIVGNPHSLKKLKEIGFKTFDKWWDESYDTELDLSLRLKKITKLLEEISQWDLLKCMEIRKEMRDILIHNYKILISDSGLYKLYSTLQTNSKIIKKTFI